MEECVAVKCNKLSVHHGNMNGASKFSPEQKERNDET